MFIHPRDDDCIFRVKISLIENIQNLENMNSRWMSNDRVNYKKLFKSANKIGEKLQMFDLIKNKKLLDKKNNEMLGLHQNYK